jgi:hypothetical protein
MEQRKVSGFPSWNSQKMERTQKLPPSPPPISTKALITQIASFSAQEGESWEYFPGVKILRREAEAPNIYVMPSLLRGAIPPLPPVDCMTLCLTKRRNLTQFYCILFVFVFYCIV